MKSIYRNEQSKKAVWNLYDRQMENLDAPYTDLYIDTSFGRTHLIECGNLTGKPLLVFHGVNATTAYNLKYCRFLLKDFHIYAVDTIGHPGKSAEVSLSPRNQDYGKWAVDVIKGLGFDRIACFGGSFGAGIVVKAMCVAPELIGCSVLLVPSAIKNAPTYKSINMAFPMLMYALTHKEKWFVRCILPMAITESNITEDILTTARSSIDNAKIKSVMSQNERMFYCIEGEFDIEFEDGLTHLCEGDFIIIPKGTKHRSVCKTLVKCLLMEVEGALNKENTGGTYTE